MPVAAIIDRDPGTCGWLADQVRQYLCRSTDPWQIKTAPSCSSLQAFCDIAIVSANDGLDGVRQMRERDKRVAILLTSDTEDYVLQGYGLSVSAYLRTPVEAPRLRQGLETALRRLGRSACIDLPAADGIHREELKNILYFEGKSGRNHVHTYDNSYSLKAPPCPLPPYFFCCDGRWINLTCIRRITGGTLWLGNLVLPISAGAKQQIMDHLPAVI